MLTQVFGSTKHGTKLLIEIPIEIPIKTDTV
jgi:hypothetical protein